MNELMTRESGQMAVLLKMLEHASDHIELLTENYRSILDEECYLTGREVTKLLKTCRRILQGYRDTGCMFYIQLEGKILYRESDIEWLLMEGYRGAFHIGTREGHGKNVGGGKSRARIEKWTVPSGICKKHLQMTRPPVGMYESGAPRKITLSWCVALLCMS